MGSGLRAVTIPAPVDGECMQNLLNLLPLVAFVVGYYLRDIYLATQVLMVSMVLVAAIDWFMHGRVSRMHMLSTVLILLFGSATLLLHDPRFLKWKPTIFMWLVALAFLGSQWIGRQTLAQRMLQPTLPEQADLPRLVWLRANLAWVLCYALMGIANLWVAFNASERVWVNFKVFGLTAVTMLFAMGQAWWLHSRVARS